VKKTANFAKEVIEAKKYMLSISTKTAQNVNIDYELASWGERFLAFLLDFAIIYFGWLITLAALSFILGGDIGGIIATIIFTPYTLVSEILMKGQTIGKKALKIRAMNISGESLEFHTCFTRWCARLLDVAGSLGTLATLTISVSDKRQRIGDLLANTVVIKEKDSNNIFLEEILKLKVKDNVKVVYEKAMLFNEEEMLFIKNTLSRVKKYKNEAHFRALDDLCEKVSDRLNLYETPKNKEAFLKQLIKDYIILTR